MVDPRIGVPYGEGVNGNRGPYDDEHQRWERQARAKHTMECVN